MLPYVIAVLAASPECPCIQVTLPSQGGCLAPTCSSMLEVSAGICGDVNYGSTTCSEWDQGLNSACSGPNPAPFCAERWCYVNATKCKASSRRYKRSKYFAEVPGLFFSYLLTKRLWWDEWAERVKWESASRGARSALLASRLVDSWYESYLTVLGGAPSYDEHHRLATRLLNAGLGLFLVVLLSAYTANLAAFLGQPSTEDYWHDIEEATAAGAKICAHVVLRSKLTQRYPSTNFHFRNMDVASDVRAGIAVDQCQAFIMATRDMDVGTTVDAVRCELGFVQAGNPVEEQTVAWPAALEIATALSYWMAQAAASGVTYQSIQNKYETDPICPRFPAVGSSDGLSQLNLTNFGAPLLIMVIFMILAIATRTLRTAHVAARKSVKRWSTKRVQDMEMQVEENTMTASTNQATIAQNVGKIEQNSAVSLANKAKIGELEEEIEGASEERSQLRKDLQEVTAAQKELIQMLRTHAGMLGGAPAPSWEAGK